MATLTAGFISYSGRPRKKRAGILAGAATVSQAEPCGFSGLARPHRRGAGACIPRVPRRRAAMSPASRNRSISASQVFASRRQAGVGAAAVGGGGAVAVPAGRGIPARGRLSRARATDGRGGGARHSACCRFRGDAAGASDRAIRRRADRPSRAASRRQLATEAAAPRASACGDTRSRWAMFCTVTSGTGVCFWHAGVEHDRERQQQRRRQRHRASPSAGRGTPASVGRLRWPRAPGAAPRGRARPAARTCRPRAAEHRLAPLEEVVEFVVGAGHVRPPPRTRPP